MIILDKKNSSEIYSLLLLNNSIISISFEKINSNSQYNSNFDLNDTSSITFLCDDKEVEDTPLTYILGKLLSKKLNFFFKLTIHCFNTFDEEMCLQAFLVLNNEFELIKEEIKVEWNDVRRIKVNDEIVYERVIINNK